MIKNFTNHKLVIFSPKDVEMNRHNKKLTLTSTKNTIAPVLVVPQSGVALNVHELQGVRQELYECGVAFKSASPYSQIVDNIDMAMLNPDDLLVVSHKYAEAAKLKLPPYLVDRMFTPSGRVYDSSGKVIGCTCLAKVAAFQLPSTYLSAPADLITKKLAVMYWKQNYFNLPPYEVEALRNLELTCNAPL